METGTRTVVWEGTLKVAVGDSQTERLVRPNRKGSNMKDGDVVDLKGKHRYGEGV